MQAFSATQALSPAIERTKSLLFQPFRWGTYLKLCAVAVFTEELGGNFNSNFSSSHQHADLGAASVPIHFSPILVAVLVLAAIVAIALGIAIFYLAVRLRFALFECLIRQSRLIRPGWHGYRGPANRFFLLCLVVGLVFCAVAVAVLAPFLLGIWSLVHAYQTSGQVALGGVLALVLPLIPIFLLLVLAAIAADILLRDFMLPHMALENATAGQAWAAVRTRIACEKGDFLLYAVLRVILPVVAVIGLFIVLIIPGILVFGSLGVLMGVVHAIFSGATGAGLLVRVLLEAVLGLAILALALFLAISVGGPLCIAIRNYALVFYGGRYRALGDILSPPPPLPPAPATQPGIA